MCNCADTLAERSCARYYRASGIRPSVVSANGYDRIDISGIYIDTVEGHIDLHSFWNKLKGSSLESPEETFYEVIFKVIFSDPQESEVWRKKTPAQRIMAADSTSLEASTSSKYGTQFRQSAFQYAQPRNDSDTTGNRRVLLTQITLLDQERLPWLRSLPP